MKIFSLICAIFGLLPLSLIAQHGDSLLASHVLRDVVIVAEPKDVSTREDWQTIVPMHLGQFLQNNGYGQIQAYGPDGTMSSLRFRGLASDYTTVYWNDIPLNSITHGGTDLSMIPLFFLDEVESDRTRSQSTNQWNNMSNGLYLRSGRVDASVMNKVRLVQSYSALHNASSGFEWAWNRKRISSKTTDSEKRNWYWGGTSRLFYQSLRNEFEYIDQFQLDKPVVQQRHNNGINQGILQTLYVAKGRQRLEWDGWWQDRRMALPLQMGQTGHSSQEQDDGVRRMNIRYSVGNDRLLYKLALAESHENMAFRDHLQSDGQWMLDSRSKAVTRLFNNTVSWVPNAQWSLGCSALGVSNTVINSNYAVGRKNVQWMQAAADARWRVGRFVFSAGGRHEFREIVTKPNMHLAMLWKERARHRRLDWVTQVQVARRFRSPDLNDLYWAPGGNPQLRPEEGITLDGFANLNGSIGAHWNFKLLCNVYFTEMTNMIVWLPASQSWWSPVNVQHAQSTGVDGLVEWAFKSKIMHWENKYRVQLNRSLSENRLLPYMPQVVQSLQSNVGWSKWTFGASAVYTSLRYTDAHNKAFLALDPYWLLGAELGHRHAWANHSLHMVLSVVNAMNTSYQSVRGYAIPGRYVQIQISYLFNQKYAIQNNEVELLRELVGH